MEYYGMYQGLVTSIKDPAKRGRIKLKCPDGESRRLCYALPVHIGDNCWICANVTILPGVTIGEGCVIGAGSVVTHSIPAHSFAAGNPCRVIREITKEDSMKYKPEILGASRKKRIALGSGTTVEEVNKLLKQFDQITKMMKQFSGNGKFKKGKMKLPF